MNTLHVELTDCYGIRALSTIFDFSQSAGTNRPAKAYAIYAPNGCMKSSFAKTFDQLTQGKRPIEERYQRTSVCTVQADDAPIPADSIYVLKADMDLKADIPAVTNLLVKPDQKGRYDQLVVDLEKKKQKVLTGLNKISGGLAKKKIEQQLLTDFETSNFLEAVHAGLAEEPDPTLSVFNYNTIFDEKALKIGSPNNFMGKDSIFRRRTRWMSGNLRSF